MAQNQKRISSQSLLAIMATFVSICALVVSVMQTYYQNRYLHGSSWPHLQISADREEFGDSTRNSIKISLHNKGVGPAIIESVEYSFKGEKQTEGLSEMIEKVIQTKDFTGSYKNISAGDVFAQNENLIHIHIMGGKAYRNFSNSLEHLSVRIVYASVHGERWELISSAQLPSGHKTTKLE